MTVSTSFEQVVAKTCLQPRDYQIRLGNKALAMFRGQYRNGAGELENAAKTVAIEAPTGSGKTSLSLCIVKAMQIDDPDLMAIWITMRRNLLKQAKDENDPPTDWNLDGKNIGANITFMSMFCRQLPEEFLYRNRRRPLIFIVDEMQHDAASTATHLHNEMRPEYVLGASAFPYRTDRVKLAFEKKIADAGIHELIQAGYLSPYEHYAIPEWSPATVAKFYTADPERWGPSLAYFNTLELCAEFRDRVNATGFRCEQVDASTNREVQIDNLKSGKTDILVNCFILTEGFNFPDLKTCFVRNSWHGCVVQMGGRVFRQSKLYPCKQIVQAKDTIWPFPKTATPIQSFVWREDEWLTLKINSQIERVVEEVRFCISEAEDTVPLMLKEVDVKGRRKRRRI